ncbi:hypothetical protein KC19_11G010200 [Ceratodon purpureus]|uniref:Uncharacterized protein n=2 Tax=Ceratodon purpureus TaxID=3225 RepID=A0A8T0GCV8_CERPU|nr:hypothetical protein KC19_11G010200 [Ceratodon purpureus]
MTSLKVSTTFGRTENLQHLHNVWTNVTPFFSGHRRHGLQLSAPVSNSNASRGRVAIVRAGACPFGFKSSASNGNWGSSMETKVSTASPSVNTPYAPAPSSNAPDHVNLGPGTYEYLPLKIPFRMTMGIEPLEMEDWVEIDVFYDEEMTLRREILETRKEVAIVSRPEAADANWEVLEMLAEFLPQRFPSRFRREGSMLFDLTIGDTYDINDKSLDPLEVIARLIQEDVCVMMKVDGKLRLVSGAVLFPQRWHLLEKMGMDMRSIHLPVPLYADVIGSAVDHFMNRLKVDKPVWRANWAIVDDPTLFQPLNEEDIYAALQGNVKNNFDFQNHNGDVGSRLYTRCERETLVRLPRSGAILFTIRTYIRPLTVFESRPELAKQMVRAMQSLPDSIAKYKTMAGFYDVALEYLQRCAAQSTG